jgi:hypothetical protein
MNPLIRCDALPCKYVTNITLKTDTLSYNLDCASWYNLPDNFEIDRYFFDGAAMQTDWIYIGLFLNRGGFDPGGGDHLVGDPGAAQVQSD